MNLHCLIKEVSEFFIKFCAVSDLECCGKTFQRTDKGHFLPFSSLYCILKTVLHVFLTFSVQFLRFFFVFLHLKCSFKLHKTWHCKVVCHFMKNAWMTYQKMTYEQMQYTYYDKEILVTKKIYLMVTDMEVMRSATCWAVVK